MTKKTQDLLAQRGTTHGAFSDHARITQRLKAILRMERLARHKRGQPELNHMQLEALEMILHKIGRIIAGEASFQDHWDDIAGYALLPGQGGIANNPAVSSIPDSAEIEDNIFAQETFGAIEPLSASEAGVKAMAKKLAPAQ